MIPERTLPYNWSGHPVFDTEIEGSPKEIWTHVSTADELPQVETWELYNVLKFFDLHNSTDPEVIEQACKLLADTVMVGNPFEYLDAQLAAALRRANVRRLSRYQHRGYHYVSWDAWCETAAVLGLSGTLRQWSVLAAVTAERDLSQISTEEAATLLQTVVAVPDDVLPTPPGFVEMVSIAGSTYDLSYMTERAAKVLLPDEEDTRALILEGLTGTVREFAEDLAAESYCVPRYVLEALATRMVSMRDPYRMFDVCERFRLYTDASLEALSQLLELDEDAILSLMSSQWRHLEDALAAA